MVTVMVMVTETVIVHASRGAAVLVKKINVRKHHTLTVRMVVATLAQMTFMDVVAIKAPHIVQTMNSLLKYVVRLATVAVNAKYVRKF